MIENHRLQKLTLILARMFWRNAFELCFGWLQEHHLDFFNAGTKQRLYKGPWMCFCGCQSSRRLSVYPVQTQRLWQQLLDCLALYGCSCRAELWLANSGQCLFISCVAHYKVRGQASNYGCPVQSSVELGKDLVQFWGKKHLNVLVNT